MICANCGSHDATQAGACPDCGADPILDGSYALLEIIGKGGAGVTYRARRLDDRAIVCVKELAYNRLANFDAQKMFEREASVLRQLDHPGIPAFVDHFTAGEGKALSLYLVQEFVDGHTLEQEMADERYTEREVLGILDELAGILAYLEELRPRVVHRDIKPANILRSDSDGRLMLVDFGSVKATTQADGETIVGTAGYMPPEQAWGTATPQSDFYSLGVLGVVLLSRRDPHELLDSTHQLDWEPHVDCAPETRELLSHLLRADPKERPESADAIQRLIGRAREQLDNPNGSLQKASNRSPQRAASQQPQRRAPGEIVEGHNHAQPKPRRVIIVLALATALLVAGVGAALAVLTTGASEPDVQTVEVSAPAPSPEPKQSTCPGGNCKSAGTAFKDALAFGMSQREVVRALEKMGDVQEVEPRRETHPSVRGSDEFAKSLPGTRLEVETETIGEDSICEADLAVDERLSAIRCDFEPKSSLSSHRAVSGRLVEALTERYGTPEDTSNFVAEGKTLESNSRWWWSDDEGRIDVVSRIRRVDGVVEVSQIRVEQRIAAHQKLVEDAEARSLEAFENRRRERKDEPL